MGQEVVVERAVEVGAFLERLREDFPCECPVLPIALHKADLPLSPPALPVRSVMQEQTDGSRLHGRHPSGSDGFPKADIARRTAIE